MMAQLARVCVLGLIPLISGCFSGEATGTVDGKLYVNDAPMGGFEISFTSVAHGFVANGFAQADGTYWLIRGRADKQIPVGDYKVSIAPSAFVPNVKKPNVKLAGKVSSLEETTMTQTIKAGPNVIDLRVTTE
ncbi:hypothetical protein [Planctomicrobium sp. SH664]|uniref:hypothetical protein n=1 Tax=Planctomicrobium sp. SH664 TaxID=3448125 RepID=UPI003F5B0C95